jgi:hypothetical protein
MAAHRLRRLMAEGEREADLGGVLGIAFGVIAWVSFLVAFFLSSDPFFYILFALVCAGVGLALAWRARRDEAALVSGAAAGATLLYGVTLLAALTAMLYATAVLMVLLMVFLLVVMASGPHYYGGGCGGGSGPSSGPDPCCCGCGDCCECTDCCGACACGDCGGCGGCGGREGERREGEEERGIRREASDAPARAADHVHVLPVLGRVGVVR